MKYSWLAVVAIAALFAFYFLGPHSLSSMEPEIRSSMTQWTRDPNSLQFTDLRYSNQDKDVICGKMNAKNSFGAYTGFKIFAYVKSRKFTFLEGIDPSADTMIDLFRCR